MFSLGFVLLHTVLHNIILHAPIHISHIRF